MDLILYHKGCPDGWCAAYLASKRYPEAELLAWDQGTEPPYERVTGKDVLSVDLRWINREAVQKAQALAKSFMIIDHHASGEGELDGLPDYVFDVKRSGAGLTWDYLFGIDSDNSPFDADKFAKTAPPRPWYVNYVEDRDLWKFGFPNAHEFSAYINSLPFTVDAWDKLNATKFEQLDELRNIGAALLRQEASYVDIVIQYAAHGSFFGVPVLIANANYFIASELGAKLCRLDPTIHVSVSYYERPLDNEIYFSLRGDGSVDVSELAKKFPGGGGHHNAGGFHVPTSQGRDIIDQILGRL